MDRLPFIVHGCGGHGKVVLDIACRLGVTVDVLLDDRECRNEVLRKRVMVPESLDWAAFGRFQFLVAIGCISARDRIYRELQMRGGVPRSLIHPFTSVSSCAQVGGGVSVCAGAVINPGAVVEENCIINTCASVDHDCVIGAHSHICPGVRLAGNVVVGPRTMVGTGACVLPGVRIGEGCIVGAGGVVNRDLPPRCVAVGVPARVVRKLEEPASE